MNLSGLQAGVLIGGLLLSTVALAEDHAGPSVNGSQVLHERALSINPFGVFGHGIEVNYHHLVDTGNSWQLGLIFYGSVLSNSVGSGFGGLGGYNWHFKGDDLRGFYVGPRLGLQTSVLEGDDESEPRTQSLDVIVGGAGGYRWIAPQGWSFSAGAATHVRVHTSETARDYGYKQTFVPGLELTLGYAF